MKLISYVFLAFMTFSVVYMGFFIFQDRAIVPDSWFPTHFTAILFSILFIIWILSEAINSIVSMTSSGGVKKDKGSFWLIVIIVIIVIFVSLNLRGSNIGTFSGNLQYVGFALIIIGIIIREFAIFILGKSFTVRVEIRKERKLVTKGPYKYIRHPSYTGGLLTIIGLPIATGSWTGALIIFVIAMLAYHYRIKVEEKALQESFRNEYTEYKKHTWKLIPGY